MLYLYCLYIIHVKRCQGFIIYQHYTSLILFLTKAYLNLFYVIKLFHQAVRKKSIKTCRIQLCWRTILQHILKFIAIIKKLLLPCSLGISSGGAWNIFIINNCLSYYIKIMYFVICPFFSLLIH